MGTVLVFGTGMWFTGLVGLSIELEKTFFEVSNECSGFGFNIKSGRECLEGIDSEMGVAYDDIRLTPPLGLDSC